MKQCNFVKYHRKLNKGTSCSPLTFHSCKYRREIYLVGSSVFSALYKWYIIVAILHTYKRTLKLELRVWKVGNIANSLKV